MSYFLAIIIQYSIFYIYIYFILQFFSGSSSLRRNFRHLAAPENNFLLLFQSVFCKLQQSPRGGWEGVGIIAGQSEGTYFSLIFSQKRHLARRKRVFPGSHSSRFILSVCVHTEHIWSSINTYIPRRTWRLFMQNDEMIDAFKIFIVHPTIFYCLSFISYISIHLFPVCFWTSFWVPGFGCEVFR